MVIFASFKRLQSFVSRRPKGLVPSNHKPSLLLDYQFVDAITDPSGDRRDRLFTKFTKYLDVLETYDDYDKHLNENEPDDVHDEHTWHTICRFRRLRIQTEFHIVACRKDAADKADLLDGLTREKQATIKRLKSSATDRVHNRQFYYQPDPDVNISYTMRI